MNLILNEKTKMSIESQNKAVLAHLEQGKTITSIEALNLYGCFRLGARIHNLRESGYNIKTNMVKQGEKRFAEYSLDNSKDMVRA